MTIQVSVLLWTIICFCLMMLILNKLLFKPLLALMDARNDRIRRAQERKQAFDQACQAALEEHSRAEAEFRHEKAREAAETVASLQEAQEQILAAAQVRQEQALLAYEEELSSEFEALNTELDRGREELAKAFALRLVS